MIQPPVYYIKEKVWIWVGNGAWHFVTIPKETADEIIQMFGYLKAGWGSLPVKLTMGKTTWKTSIFPDKKTGGYLIPLKSEVRKMEKVSIDDQVEIKIEVLV